MAIAGEDMDLKEFLTQTILQIVEGVQDAQERMVGDALINPPAQLDDQVVTKARPPGDMFTRWSSMSRLRYPAGQQRKRGRASW